MRAAAILLAAGRGERLGADAPKGFVHLDGRPLVAFALDAVRACPAVDAAVVAVPPGYEATAARFVGPDDRVVAGGPSRQASVVAAMSSLPGEGLDAVVVHDVARPLASSELFERVLEGLSGADGVVPAVPVTDTIKRVEDGAVAETLARDALVAVQTPQAFRLSAFERAHALAARDGFEGTDDASLLERAGLPVAVVAGETRNMKISRPEDLMVASVLARSR